jgi:hypothetical protein
VAAAEALLAPWRVLTDPQCDAFENLPVFAQRRRP